jgi:multidrug efflux pump
MAELQQAAAKEILADPDVESLSSNVGVDAANNMMLHTGRMLINLKAERSASQADIMERLRRRAANVAGVTLYLQPTQDLTIDAESGPTLYRASIEGADNATVTEWAGKLVKRLAPVDHRRIDRRRALQRIWPAHRLHHLHRNQPVPRDSRSAA